MFKCSCILFLSAYGIKPTFDLSASRKLVLGIWQNKQYCSNLCSNPVRPNSWRQCWLWCYWDVHEGRPIRRMSSAIDWVRLLLHANSLNGPLTWYDALCSYEGSSFIPYPTISDSVPSSTVVFPFQRKRKGLILRVSCYCKMMFIAASPSFFFPFAPPIRCAG